MWYQMELIGRERHERMQREAEQNRMHRLGDGLPRSPVRPRRLRISGRR
ncbi:hypothetical protein BH24CHL5_BH24CHL5_12330 [soil metagenome]